MLLLKNWCTCSSSSHWTHGPRRCPFDPFGFFILASSKLSLSSCGTWTRSRRWTTKTLNKNYEVRRITYCWRLFMHLIDYIMLMLQKRSPTIWYTVSRFLVETTHSPFETVAHATKATPAAEWKRKCKNTEKFCQGLSKLT